MWHLLPLLASALVAPSPSPSLAAHARPRLVFEHSGAAPGDTLTAAIIFDIDPKWHLYWDGQNDTGQPPALDNPTLPAGVTLGSFQWPTPERQVLEGDIVDHVYATRAVLLLPITLAKDVKPGSTIKLELPLRWMECASICQLGEAKVSGSFRVLAQASDATPTGDAKLVQAARAALPAPLPTDGSVTFTLSGDLLTISAKGADALTFMPASASRPVANLASDPVAKGDSLRVKLKEDPKAGSKGVIGVLQVVKGKTKAHFLVDTTAKTDTKKDKNTDSAPAQPGSGTPPGR